MKNFFRVVILVGLTSNGFSFTSGLRSDLSLFAASEQAVAVSQVSRPISVAQDSAVLDKIERAIRNSNAGSDAASLRVPVSTPRLVLLQTSLAAEGHFVPLSELRPMVDTGHTLLRETPTSTLAQKLARYAEVERKPMHGAVAELPEARARGMVLTKSRVSQSIDLTQAVFRPKNAQLKIYQNEVLAINKAAADLARHGGTAIVAKSTMQVGLQNGLIVETPYGNRYAGNRKVAFEASKIFMNPADSHEYTNIGKEALLRRSESIRETANTATRTQSTTKWLGRAGLIGSAGVGIYSAHQYYSGQISERQFDTRWAGLAGGVTGGWVGMKAGAATGAVVGAALTPEALGAGAVPGALIGGIVGALGGGYAGAKLGEGAMDYYYNSLDAEQNEQLRQFVYSFYKVSR